MHPLYLGKYGPAKISVEQTSKHPDRRASRKEEGAHLQAAIQGSEKEVARDCPWFCELGRKNHRLDTATVSIHMPIFVDTNLIESHEL